MWSIISNPNRDPDSINTNLTLLVFSPGFTYIYSGPYMFEYDLRSGRLYRVLRNAYFLRCTNF